MKHALIAAALVALALPAAATPRPALSWQVFRDGGNISLVYGPPPDGGEDYNPGLSCREHHGLEVLFYTDTTHFPIHQRGDSMVNGQGRPGPWPATITVRSGALTAQIAGHVEYDDIGDAIEVDVTIPNGSPMLAQIARTGQITVSAFGSSPGFARVPMPMLTRFLTYCHDRRPY